MRVLFLLQDVPFPPSTGINSKAYSVIKYLAGKGWECDLLCIGTGHAAARAAELEKIVPGVKVLGIYAAPTGLELSLNKASNFLRGLPPSLAEFYSHDLREALVAATSAKKYNAVHYDVINMAQYLAWGPAAPSVLSSNDAISLAYERMIRENEGLLRKAYLAAAAFLIRRFERNYYPRFSAVHVVSEEDAAHLKRVCPEMKIEVIPLAADAEFVEARPDAENRGKPLKVIFTGNLDIPGIANGLLEFLDTVYLDLVAAVPPFEFHVLGPQASKMAEKRLSAFPGLKYLRWVEDYKDFMASADIVLILDKSGTGIKTRVLAAMALGKPVIGTTIAFGGICSSEGKDCLIRNTPAAIGEALKLMLSDNVMREKIGSSARELIVSAYTMEVLGPKWEVLYSGLKAPVRSQGPSDLQVS